MSDFEFQNMIQVIGVPAPQGPPHLNQIQPPQPRADGKLPGRPENNKKLVKELESELSRTERDKYEKYWLEQQKKLKVENLSDTAKKQQLFQLKMNWLVKNDGGDLGRKERAMERKPTFMAKVQKKAQRKEDWKEICKARNAKKVKEMNEKKERQKERKRQEQMASSSQFKNGGH